jgi:hypothetical protein
LPGRGLQAAFTFQAHTQVLALSPAAVSALNRNMILRKEQFGIGLLAVIVFSALVFAADKPDQQAARYAARRVVAQGTLSASWKRIRVAAIIAAR